MSKQDTINLLEKAITAIFEAEQVIRKEEKAHVNKPMYRMRCEIQQIINEYTEDRPICEFQPDMSFEGLLKQHTEELNRSNKRGCHL